MYIQSLLFKPSIKLEKRQLFNDTTLIDLLQELFLYFFQVLFCTFLCWVKVILCCPIAAFPSASSHYSLEKKNTVSCYNSIGRFSAWVYQKR